MDASLLLRFQGSIAHCQELAARANSSSSVLLNPTFLAPCYKLLSSMLSTAKPTLSPPSPSPPLARAHKQPPVIITYAPASFNGSIPHPPSLALPPMVIPPTHLCCDASSMEGWVAPHGASDALHLGEHALGGVR